MFEPLFLRLALAASMATGVSLGVMGVYLVVKRVVFLGLVVANAATLGAAVAQAAGWPEEPISLGAAVGAAIALGGGGTGRISGESLMGWAYAATSSATVLILSSIAGGSSDTLHLLFGNVLAVQTADVAELMIIAAAVVLAQGVFGGRFLLVTFDPEAASVAGVNVRRWSLGLSLAIGAAAATAVHAIGALLTFSLLTLPAMTALVATKSVRATFVTAAILGAGLTSLGLAAAYYLDLPAGPASVALLVISVPIVFAARSGAPTGGSVSLVRQ
jgi:ABC-type Mn2+/Zn2+ transport system permease subunit